MAVDKKGRFYVTSRSSPRSSIPRHPGVFRKPNADQPLTTSTLGGRGCRPHAVYCRRNDDLPPPTDGGIAVKMGAIPHSGPCDQGARRRKLSLLHQFQADPRRPRANALESGSCGTAGRGWAAACYFDDPRETARPSPVHVLWRSANGSNNQGVGLSSGIPTPESCIRTVRQPSMGSGTSVTRRDPPWGMASMPLIRELTTPGAIAAVAIDGPSARAQRLGHDALLVEIRPSARCSAQWSVSPECRATCVRHAGREKSTIVRFHPFDFVQDRAIRGAAMTASPPQPAACARKAACRGGQRIAQLVSDASRRPPMAAETLGPHHLLPGQLQLVAVPAANRPRPPLACESKPDRLPRPICTVRSGLRGAKDRAA